MAKRVEVLKNVALIGGWQKEESTKRKKKKNLLPLILLSPDSPEEEGRKEKEEKKDDDKTPGLVPGADTSAYPQTNKEKKGGKFPKRDKIETVKRKKEVPFGFCSFVSLSSTPEKVGCGHLPAGQPDMKQSGGSHLSPPPRSRFPFCIGSHSVRVV